MDGNNKNKTVLSIVLIISALLIGGITYYYYQRETNIPKSQEPQNREVAGEKDTQDQETPVVIMPEPDLEEDEVAVFFVDVGNRRNIEETFGCDDSLSYLVRQLEGEDLTINEKVETAITYLISTEDRYVGKGGLYNVFYNSNLTLDKVDISDSTAKVYLDGELILGGACDNPRVEAQLKNTATQFDEIDNAEIYLNGELLDLSLEG